MAIDPSILTSLVSFLRFGAFVLLLVSFVSPSPTFAQPQSTEPSRLMMIRFAPNALGLPGPAEDIPDLLADRSTGIFDQLAVLLGGPETAFPLITDRLPREARDAMDATDPGRVLQSFTVLRYANVALLLAAKTRLERDPIIAFVKQAESVQFSVAPTDPYYPAGATALTGQWAPPVLNLPNAWDVVTGTAYVGVVDNGIQPTHPDLLAAYRPHFSANFAGGTTVDEAVTGLQGVGHGTHVAGIIAAQPNNGQGVAGTCWNCNLMIGRVSGFSDGLTEPYIINAINGLVDRGAQILNMSFGGPKAFNYCGTSPNDPYCLALSKASIREVVMVSASGNNKSSAVNFPAADSRVIGVGGTQVDGGIWDQQVTLPSSIARSNIASTWFGRELGQNFGPGQTLVAPARDILSTFYQSQNWNVDFRCGTANPFNSPEIAFPGSSPGYAPDSARYGICTGTSMAAPFVTGIAALVRSVNPLRTATDVRTSLTFYASRAFSPNQDWGYGLPNAAASVQSVLSSNNRLTPLFAMSRDDDYLLTTAPQMALASWLYGLKPEWPSPPATRRYQSDAFLGNPLSNYTRFPGMKPPNKRGPRPGQDGEMPRARFYLFTTRKDASGQTLDPVYRFSFAGSGIVRHVYAVGLDKANVQTPTWTLDGIEGYVYPANIPQPSGTVAISRWFNSPAFTYVLVPSVDQSAWTARGFVSNSGVLGFAILNPPIFADVPAGHAAKAEIESMYHSEITLGCGGSPLNYCPTPAVTRAQMAAFAGRAAHAAGWIPPSYTSIFPDVPSYYSLKDWVMQTYYDGIMGQCPMSPGNFCPDASIIREEMAQVLLRVKYGASYTPPPAGAQIFNDVPTSSPWAPWIHKLYNDGITLGCGANPPLYCPSQAVTRETMAIFLSRTLGLLQ